MNNPRPPPPAKALFDHVRIFEKASTVVTVPRWRVQDIDTPEDWERAQIVWRVLQTMEAVN